jgi:restriction system protein
MGQDLSEKYGLLENSERGVWAFTPKYNPQDRFSSREVVQSVRIADSARRPELPQGETRAEEVIVATPEMEADWRVILHRQLMGLAPDAFERLAMRLLRESGFVHVEVTGRSGDGGIDGKGIVKIQNILSYHVVFQCKRYRESVGAAHIRDFRGAMIGRADKGLFITTGTFTRDAVKEASRDGTSPIDLVDGESLIDMLKNLKLGVSVHMVEEVEVDADWFKGI